MAENLSLSDLLTTIGNNLHTIRNARKETLQSVAKAIRVSHPVISRTENGRNKSLTLSLLVRLCNYYDITLQQVLATEVVQIFQPAPDNGSGDHKLTEQATLESYKEEISYLRGLVEKFILRKGRNPDH